MFYRHCQSHPAFILGQSPPTITPAAPLFLGEAEPDQADQFKSQFARRLLSDGSQLSRADLEKLRQENVSLKQRVERERERVGSNKLDFLQTELQVLRERVGKVGLSLRKGMISGFDVLMFQISAEISLQDISTQHLLTSVHTITRQLSIYNQHDNSGIKRSKSCFQVNPRDPPAVKKRSKSVAGDLILGDQRRQSKLEERRQENRQSSPTQVWD